MQDDRNLFGNHSINQTYNTFKSRVDDAVMSGKMTHLDAIEHMNKLRSFAQEKNHDSAASYMHEHSKKLGWETNEKWNKEENWSR